MTDLQLRKIVLSIIMCSFIIGGMIILTLKDVKTEVESIKIELQKGGNNE